MKRIAFGRMGASAAALMISVASVVFHLETAFAAPMSVTMSLGGQPGDTIVYNGSTTPIPQGMSFYINVDTSTADTWAATDFGYFPADSVYVTVPDLGITDVLVTTPLGYYEDDSPRERAGISRGGSSGAGVFLPSAGNSAIGNPNVIDTIPSFSGVGNMNGGFRFTLVTGDEFYDPMGTGIFGASSLTATVPEASTFALLAMSVVGLIAYRWRRRDA